MIEEANAYKQEIIAKAEGETARFLKLKSVYELAPEVTREQCIWKLLKSPRRHSPKVLVDVKVEII